jgi:hypothetical protein
MTLEERSNLVLAFVRALYVNGQSTNQTVATAERLDGGLRYRSRRPAVTRAVLVAPLGVTVGSWEL